MIPHLEDGLLPDGVHSCSFGEMSDSFGRFQRSDRRPRLTEALRRYVEAVRESGIAVALIVDGSYITMKDEPNDIDLILVLRQDLDVKQEITPAEYNVQSGRLVKRLYGFDVLPAVQGSQAYEKHLHLFSRVRLDDPEVKTNRTTKGVLRIDL